MKFDLVKIMTRAWEIYRKNKHYHAESFAEALHRSWSEYKMYPEVHEILEKAVVESGIEETVKTWFEWTLDGRKVMHDEKSLFSVEIPYPAWGDGRTKVVHFFGYHQTDLAENVA